jgi:hypothetical protein
MKRLMTKCATALALILCLPAYSGDRDRSVRAIVITRSGDRDR